MSRSEEKQGSGYESAIAAQLFQTQTLIQNLLSELRENSSSVATLSAEMKHLRINVQTLMNIIRGDDGNTKPLLWEVEAIKAGAAHIDKRMTEIINDYEDQILSLGKNIAEMGEKLEEKIAAEEAERREYETKQMELAAADRQQTRALTQAENVDLRSDSRQKLQMFVTLVLSILSLAGTIAVAALSVKK